MERRKYTGIRTFGKIQTNRFAHLQIIEDDLFLLAQKRIEDSRLDSPNLGATKYRQEVLLPAEMFCMHCGKRMTVTRNVKTIIHQDGTRTTYPRLNYICINKSSLHPCTGQRSYSAKKIDPVVLSLLSMALFAEINSSPQPGLYKYEVQMTEIQKDIEREQENLDSLKTEVIAILQGSSAFGSDLINDLIQQTKSRLAALQGLKIMKEIMYANSAKDIDGVATFEFKDSYNFNSDFEQLCIFNRPLQSLCEDLYNKNKGKQKTVKELYDPFVYDVSNYFVAKNVKDALKRLEAENRLVVISGRKRKYVKNEITMPDAAVVKFV